MSEPVSEINTKLYCSPHFNINVRQVLEVQDALHVIGHSLFEDNGRILLAFMESAQDIVSVIDTIAVCLDSTCSALLRTRHRQAQYGNNGKNGQLHLRLLELLNSTAY
jgi:hypothetical protein